MFFFSYISKKASNHKKDYLKPDTSEKIEILVNDLSITLFKKSKKFVHDTVLSIANGKNIKIEPVDLTFRNDIII